MPPTPPVGYTASVCGPGHGAVGQAQCASLTVLGQFFQTAHGACLVFLISLLQLG